VANFTMALAAAKSPRPATVVGKKGAVAAQTVFFHNILSKIASLNHFWDMPDGKRIAVVNAIDAFGDPLPDGIGRDVAIVAHGNVMMPARPPIVQDLTHCVAIGAGFWLVAEITRALSIDKGEDPKPYGSPRQESTRHKD
jgi:hypothetical protein